jgi:hypothetical protein
MCDIAGLPVSLTFGPDFSINLCGITSSSVKVIEPPRASVAWRRSL